MIPWLMIINPDLFTWFKRNVSENWDRKNCCSDRSSEEIVWVIELTKWYSIFTIFNNSTKWYSIKLNWYSTDTLNREIYSSIIINIDRYSFKSAFATQNNSWNKRWKEQQTSRRIRKHWNRYVYTRLQTKEKNYTTLKEM